MSYKFNTDKLNIMKLLENLAKYLMVAIIFIFFLGGIIQTTTYFQLSVKGTFLITPLSSERNITGTERVNYSGSVYLTTFAKNNGPCTHFCEEAWGEVTQQKEIRVEEMEEGPHESNPLSEKFYTFYIFDYVTECIN